MKGKQSSIILEYSSTKQSTKQILTLITITINLWFVKPKLPSPANYYMLSGVRVSGWCDIYPLGGKLKIHLLLPMRSRHIMCSTCSRVHGIPSLQSKGLELKGGYLACSALSYLYSHLSKIGSQNSQVTMDSIQYLSSCPQCPSLALLCERGLLPSSTRGIGLVW